MPYRSQSQSESADSSASRETSDSLVRISSQTTDRSGSSDRSRSSSVTIQNPASSPASSATLSTSNSAHELSSASNSSSDSKVTDRDNPDIILASVELWHSDRDVLVSRPGSHKAVNPVEEGKSMSKLEKLVTERIEKQEGGQVMRRTSLISVQSQFKTAFNPVKNRKMTSLEKLYTECSVSKMSNYNYESEMAVCGSEDKDPATDDVTSETRKSVLDYAFNPIANKGKSEKHTGHLQMEFFDVSGQKLGDKKAEEVEPEAPDELEEVPAEDAEGGDPFMDNFMKGGSADKEDDEVASRQSVFDLAFNPLFHGMFGGEDDGEGAGDEPGGQDKSEYMGRITDTEDETDSVHSKNSEDHFVKGGAADEEDDMSSRQSVFDLAFNPLFHEMFSEEDGEGEGNEEGLDSDNSVPKNRENSNMTTEGSSDEEEKSNFELLFQPITCRSSFSTFSQLKLVPCVNMSNNSGVSTLDSLPWEWDYFQQHNQLRHRRYLPFDALQLQEVRNNSNSACSSKSPTLFATRKREESVKSESTGTVTDVITGPKSNQRAFSGHQSLSFDEADRLGGQQRLSNMTVDVDEDSGSGESQGPRDNKSSVSNNNDGASTEDMSVAAQCSQDLEEDPPVRHQSRSFHEEFGKHFSLELLDNKANISQTTVLNWIRKSQFLEQPETQNGEGDYWGVMQVLDSTSSESVSAGSSNNNTNTQSDSLLKAELARACPNFSNSNIVSAHMPSPLLTSRVYHNTNSSNNQINLHYSKVLYLNTQTRASSVKYVNTSNSTTILSGCARGKNYAKAILSTVKSLKKTRHHAVSTDSLVLKNNLSVEDIAVQKRLSRVVENRQGGAVHSPLYPRSPALSDTVRAERNNSSDLEEYCQSSVFCVNCAKRTCDCQTLLSMSMSKSQTSRTDHLNKYMARRHKSKTPSFHQTPVALASEIVTQGDLLNSTESVPSSHQAVHHPKSSAKQWNKLPEVPNNSTTAPSIPNSVSQAPKHMRSNKLQLKEFFISPEEKTLDALTDSLPLLVDLIAKRRADFNLLEFIDQELKKKQDLSATFSQQEMPEVLADHFTASSTNCLICNEILAQASDEKVCVERLRPLTEEKKSGEQQQLRRVVSLLEAEPTYLGLKHTVEEEQDKIITSKSHHLISNTTSRCLNFGNENILSKKDFAENIVVGELKSRSNVGDVDTELSEVDDRVLTNAKNLTLNDAKSLQSVENAVNVPQAGPKTPEVKQAVKTPEAAVKTPEAAVKTPEAAVKTPQADVKVPQAGPKTPEVAVKTPEAAVKTPQAGPKTPEAAVKVPQAGPKRQKL